MEALAASRGCIALIGVLLFIAVFLIVRPFVTDQANPDWSHGLGS